MTTPDTEAMNKPDPRTAMVAAARKFYAATNYANGSLAIPQIMAAFADAQTADLTAKLERYDKELDIVHGCLTDLYNDANGKRIREALDEIEALAAIGEAK